MTAAEAALLQIIRKNNAQRGAFPSGHTPRLVRYGVHGRRRADRRQGETQMTNITRTDDKTFQVGVTYAARSICDHECIHAFTIERRTASSVWVNVCGKTVRRAVSTYNGIEYFMPFGTYSMAVRISADRRAA